MTLITLEKMPLSLICQTFSQAFSDYEIPVHITDDLLREMIISRDIRLDRSFGSITPAGQLTGIILCAYRTYPEGNRMYIATMGVIPTYRSQKVGFSLLEKALQCAKHHHVDQVQLEVLEHNIAAQNLYQRAGFSPLRTLRCYRTEANSLKVVDNPISVELASKQKYQEMHPEQYLPYIPSWQYDTPSVLNGYDQNAVLLVTDNHYLIGFGTVYRNNGSVAQLGIRDREKTIPLLSALARVTTASQIRVMNIASSCDICMHLENAGWENFINQYEMTYNL
jgi:ribosomal protein S18 acetylase RimI-like enzyme